jgi:uncharacterized coiled-coil protein SlyX
MKPMVAATPKTRSFFSAFTESRCVKHVPMTAEERLNELEARYAQLEDFTAQLSEALYQQQQEVALLSKALERLHRKTAGNDGQLVDAAIQERPPHY